LIYTSVVLQHMEPQLSIRYLREFARVLRPGGILVFQIPDRIEKGRMIRDRMRRASFELRRRVAFRTRTRRVLRRSGLLHKPLSPADATAEMHCLSEERVRVTLEECGLETSDVQLTNSTDLSFIGSLRYLAEPPSVGYVSKQYTAVKPADCAISAR
jgi:SAM-dependent methyltransferase